MVGLVNYAKEPNSVELRELPIPEIGEEDVLFKVQAVGICGSDLHQYTGTQSWAVNYPVVLGHEFAGSVAKLGNRVKGFKEGDRVVSETAALLPPDSAFIRQGLYNLEPKRLGFGYGVDGAMAPFVKVPARCLHHVPAELTLDKAALTEPCSVAYNAVCVNSRLWPGDTIAVIGPGPIGLLCAAMAKLSGAGHLIVIGIPADAKRLEIAKRIGADTILSAQGENVTEWVKNFGDGYGVWRSPIYRSFALGRQRIDLLRGDSHSEEVIAKTTELLGGRQVDFLFIDAGHTYQDVKQDFEFYSRFVAPGGLIAFHDIALHPPSTGCEVSRFWSEIKPQYESGELIQDQSQGWAGIGYLRWNRKVTAKSSIVPGALTSR